MDETPPLTAKENFYVSLYKDPKALFRGAVYRMLCFVIPSIGLMVGWLISKDPLYAIMGYALLLGNALQQILLTRKGIQTINSTLTKLTDKH
jgi:hypothetical protein